MATYGAKTPVYGMGQGGYLRPASSLALSAAARSTAAGLGRAATPQDPFGLAARNAKQTTGFAEPAVALQPSGSSSAPPAAPPPVAPPPPAAPPPSAAAVNLYDVNTDPALQQVKALTGLNDQQAQAQALKDRQQQVLAYGDPTLAAAILGASDPTVAAAAQNPTSTLAQLGQQRTRNLKTLTDQMNANNLLYSGYRGVQENQLGQDYQNQLAQAAGTVNSNLSQIGSNLAAALAQNAQQRASATQTATQNAIQSALAAGYSFGGFDANGNPILTPPASTGTTPGGGETGAGSGTAGSTPPENASVALPSVAQALANPLYQQSKLRYLNAIV